MACSRSQLVAGAVSTPTGHILSALAVPGIPQLPIQQDHAGLAQWTSQKDWGTTVRYHFPPIRIAIIIITENKYCQ